MNWHNVSKAEPCPICHKTDWCNLSNDGAVCICHRVESPYPARSGSGWIHALRANDERRMMNDERRWRYSSSSPITNHQSPTTTLDLLSRPTFFSSHHSTPTPNTYTYELDLGRVHAGYDADPVLIEGLATSLGVDDQPLKAMDVRFNHFDQCWSFPMRDADGKIVGLRFRELGGSKKWSARGSHDGLFYAPPPTTNHQSPTTELIIVEGPSDTAALISLFTPSLNSCNSCNPWFSSSTNYQLPTNQLPTIVGRSSCQSGASTLRQYIRRIRPRYVTIVADNDTPGIRGADLLATQLTTNHVPVRVLVVPSPYKDIRAWYLSGKLTPKLFADVVSAQRWS